MSDKLKTTFIELSFKKIFKRCICYRYFVDMSTAFKVNINVALFQCQTVKIWWGIIKMVAHWPWRVTHRAGRPATRPLLLRSCFTSPARQIKSQPASRCSGASVQEVGSRLVNRTPPCRHPLPSPPGWDRPNRASEIHRKGNHISCLLRPRQKTLGIWVVLLTNQRKERNFSWIKKSP